jgi:hypothetical protein
MVAFDPPSLFIIEAFELIVLKLINLLTKGYNFTDANEDGQCSCRR